MEIEVVNYIKEARSHGLTDLEVKQNLLKAGWEAGAVEESFAYVKAEDNRQNPGTQALSSAMTGDIKPAQPPATIQAAASPSINVATTNQPATLSDTAVMQQKKGGMWWKVLLTIIIIGVLGGGGVYAYFTYVVNNPTNVWNKFLSTSKSNVYQSEVSFSYSDPNSLDATDTFFSLKDLKFSFSGNAYANVTDPKNPQSQASLKYTYASGNTSFSTGFDYILKDKVLYVNIGDNPIFSSIFGAADNGQKVTWLKFDLNQIENASSTDAAQTKQWENIFNQDFQNQIQKIWDNAQIIKVSSFEGKEKINDVQMLHFKNTLDKQALKTAANQTVQKFVDGFRQAGETIHNSDIDNVNFAINAIVDKINVQDMETWVGQSDYRLYKVHFVSNAPSLISTINYFTKNPPTISIAENRDAKRLADIRMMASALELYFNDYNGYPAANSNGQPDGGIAPTYIGLVPTAPTPADGTCTNFYNAYWYTPTGKKHVVQGKTVYDSYTMTFCLGSDTGSYKAGIGQLSPQGIKDNIPCPSTDKSQCTAAAANNSDSIKGIQDVITKAISAIQFNATVNIDATYHDYGATKTLTPPTDAYDILGQAQEKSRDALRLADVRQYASALELYYNDKNAYPSSLQQLGPSYIDQVRSAPTPADGNCTDAQNNFNYTMENNNSSYKMTFCLGADTGGYSAGVHTLSPSGIQ